MPSPEERQLKDQLLVACEKVVVYSWFPDQPGFRDCAKLWAGRAFVVAEQLSPHLNGAVTVGRLVAQIERTMADRSIEAKLHLVQTHALADAGSEVMH